MAFQKATKTQAKLRAALFGPAGAGKTWTALSVGTGIGGKIALIDSERGSASKYADRFEFDTQMLVKKTVDEYISYINEAAAAGYDVLIIDSMTHAWETLCDEVQKIADARYKGNYWAAWSEGTPIQRKFIEALLSYPGHIIATMRSKTEWQTGSEGGKSKPVRVGLSPEQGKGIEFEFDILFEITPEHLATIIKDRTGKFQDKIIEKPGKEFGQELIAWLNEGAPPPPPQNTLRQQCVDGMKELRNIMDATADGNAKLFTVDEYNVVKQKLEGIVNQPDDVRLVVISNMLDTHKELLKTRLEEWHKAKQPEIKAAVASMEAELGVSHQPEQQAASTAATQTQPSKTAPKNDKQTLSDELREMMRKKHEEQQAAGATQKTTTATPAAADGFVDDIPGQEEQVPAMYEEPEAELVGAGTGDALDIFYEVNDGKGY